MQELEKILEEIEIISIKDLEEENERCSTTCKEYCSDIKGTECYCRDAIIVRAFKKLAKYMNDEWIPVEERLPEVFGKYWATIRYDDGRISEPVVVDFRGVRQKYVVDTPNGREYETWGIDSAFHGSRVIAWRPYYIPEPYRPERSAIKQ